MSLGRIGARAALAAVGVPVSVALLAAPSWATGGTKLCIPNDGNQSVKTPSGGVCLNSGLDKYKLVELGAEGKQGPPGPQGEPGAVPLSNAEVTTLKAILPCIKSVSTGVGGKPTVQFHGCNVQIVNGAGTTASTNGAGNLVIGYDEGTRTQTGSHNLILGQEGEFTSYGGILSGHFNTMSAPFASVLSGHSNTANVSEGVVVTGEANRATGSEAFVGGGLNNEAAAGESAIVGGEGNHIATSATLASIAGGQENKAEGFASWIGGGLQNNVFSKATAGEEGRFASIFGGEKNKTAKDHEAIP